MDLVALREQLLKEQRALAAENDALKQRLSTTPQSVEEQEQHQLRELREQLLAQNAALKQQQQVQAQNAALDRGMAQLCRNRDVARFLQSSGRGERKRGSCSKSRPQWHTEQVTSSLVSIAEGDESSDASTDQSTACSSTSGSLVTGSVATCLSDEEVDSSAETRTTVMLRNMPSELTTESFVKVLKARGFEGRFDFAYVPADFNSGLGFGYAIVNLESTATALRFREQFDSFRAWGLPADSSACAVSWNAARQGSDALRRRYWDVEDMPPASRPFILEA